MKIYINAQKPNTILEVIHHVMVVAKILTPNKGFMKPPNNGEKTFGKDHANKDTKAPGNKDQHTNGNKKKDSKKYKGQNKLSPTKVKKYQKENQCFRCKE